jgi:hypothetical protein
MQANILDVRATGLAWPLGLRQGQYRRALLFCSGSGGVFEQGYISRLFTLGYNFDIKNNN